VALQDNEVKKELERFVSLRIDIGRFDKHQIVMGEYVDDFLIPALVLLDADGNRLIHLDCRSYEDKAHRGQNDPKKLAEALRKGGAR
jgi:hypothetical protein